MLFKKAAIASVVILASVSSAAVAQTSGKRGTQQRQLDVETTQGIDRRQNSRGQNPLGQNPLGLSGPAPRQEMKMVPFPRGGRLEMILVPANPAS